MKSWSSSFVLLSAALALSGCGRPKIDRVEWPVMGTVAAIQTRTSPVVAQLKPSMSAARYREWAQAVFADVEKLLNAHDPDSELSQLAHLSESEILSSCDKVKSLLEPWLLTRPCYEAAFKLMKASGRAFNPRWRGERTLDLGAIAKGYAVDVASTTTYINGTDALLDLGGNLKALKSRNGPHRPWKTGVLNPNGEGYAATVELHEGEALATSATYYRGAHIYDGRTGQAVTNGVASVTVLCNSAMWADGLSTTLFVLGPDEGRAFLAAHQKELLGDDPLSVLWILSDNSKITLDPSNRFN